MTKMLHIDTLNPTNIANAIKTSVGLWLDEMGKGLSPGRFRFCRSRRLAPIDGKRGMGVTCFAAKSAWHIGAWPDWSAATRGGCIRFIKSFQTHNGEFIDKWMWNRIGYDKRLILAKNGRFLDALSSMRRDRLDLIRAETRQSTALLILLGSPPKYSTPAHWHNKSMVSDFIRKLDWTKPWGAGSHASHLIAFTAMQAGDTTKLSSSQSGLLDAAFEATDHFLDAETGTWGVGAISPSARINGAMKMLTAYHWAGRTVPYPKRLIDYTLSNAEDKHGCGILNKLYVLHQASLACPDYRLAELREYALNTLTKIVGYHQTDGGFSFHLNRAQPAYYGVLVSLGKRQSDMHGTVMFTWACAIALELLGLRERLGWRLSYP